MVYGGEGGTMGVQIARSLILLSTFESISTWHTCPCVNTADTAPTAPPALHRFYIVYRQVFWVP